jgi:hypothetical protein
MTALTELLYTHHKIRNIVCSVDLSSRSLGLALGLRPWQERWDACAAQCAARHAAARRSRWCVRGAMRARRNARRGTPLRGAHDARRGTPRAAAVCGRGEGDGARVTTALQQAGRECASDHLIYHDFDWTASVRVRVKGWG